MNRITRADIVFSVGRGLIMAAAITAVTYYVGSRYLGEDVLDAIDQSTDDSYTPRVEHATAPSSTDEATAQ